MKLKNQLERKFRRYFPKRIQNANQFLTPLKGKNGLEIGGPSPSLSHQGFLPVYDVLKALDGCNFGAQTVWEGNLAEGNNYSWGNKKGYQFINDGSDLTAINNKNYEVILSCHSLEHFANPIKALKEWDRVLVEDGYMLLVIPHKDGTFDHNRPVTTFAHLLNDFELNIPETDNTHFEEIISLHDIQMDAGIKNMEELITRTYANIDNRCVHHHVFNSPLVVQIADYLNLQIIELQHLNPFNIIILLQKSKFKDNTKFTNPSNPIFDRFPSDKIWNNKLS